MPLSDRWITGLVLSVILMGSLALPAPLVAAPPTRYASIGIGARTVSAAVFETSPDPTVPTRILFEKSTAPAVGLLLAGKLDPGACKRAAQDVEAFLKAMKEEYQIPPDQVRVFATGGLRDAADRELLANQVKTRTGRDLLFPNESEEARQLLNGMGLLGVPLQALVVEVSSGNIQAAGWNMPQTVESFHFPESVLSFTARAQRERKMDQRFSEAAAVLRRSLLDAAWKDLLDKHAGLRSRMEVYVTGDVAWALAVLAHPEKVGEPLSLTEADLTRLRRFFNSTPQFPDSSFEGLAGETRQRAELAVRRIRDTFRAEDLASGIEILDALRVGLARGDRPLSVMSSPSSARLLGAVAPPDLLWQRNKSPDQPARPVDPPVVTANPTDIQPPSAVVFPEWAPPPVIYEMPCRPRRPLLGRIFGRR